ncbi:SGNH/GDSL hydrolase family protein [Chitinophaga horti]|uniref:SGNH/GDSL hydrolase family protein n=1 Tax=Chitinophaga horti TaxID=2920382 RepID=A0ABY6J278_9BACT|nr:SGNH/GDSL hydrolase family protein [Chitinophaga horti]UYQ92414.1 SGNH/GDSL hydrolase family protein [Chitinophaga horti]
MKHFYALLLLALLSAPSTFAQVCTDKGFRLVIVGSSTAAGWSGPTSIDSSFGRRLKRHLEAIHPNWAVYNIATGGINTYAVQPSWYRPPVIPGDSRPAPDPAVNITRAINEFSPDAILISLPSNDASAGYPLAEQQANFNRIWATADSMNIAVWVTSTQPRDQMWGASRQPLMDMRDWLATRFGAKYIDFWTTFANTDGTINSAYASGDGIHLNNAAHRIMFERTVAEGIPDTLCKGPIRLQSLAVTAAGSGRSVAWTVTGERLMTQYVVQRSLDSLAWDSVGVVAANGSNIVTRNYTFADNSTQSTAIYYRLKLRDSRNRIFYTRGVKFDAQPVPYALSSFTGVARYNTAKLDWTTTFETKLHRIKLQRKTAVSTWKQIADLPAAGNATVPTNYTYTDTLTSDSSFYYRLHISDSSGRQFLTDSIRVNADSGYWKPFVLQNFAVTGNDTAANLSWQTTREKYTDKFFILRNNGAGWATIDSVNAAGRSSTLRSYTYIDHNRFNFDVFYRLRLQDSLGRSTFSDSVKLLKPQPPFALDSFSVTADWDQFNAGWKTLTEYNSWRFSLLRSADSVSWTTVTVVNAAGTSTTPRYYTYVDKPATLQTYYYQLKMEGLSGGSYYSNVVKVQADSSYAKPFVYSGPTVTRQNNLPYVQWSTTKEKNTLRFTVQRRLSTTSWTTAGTVNAAGNSNTLRNYSFTDNSILNEDVYYRLKMEDTSQRAFYSDSVKLNKLVIPFVLTAFTGTADYNQRNLAWTTASENGSLRFIVERSADSAAWTTVGNVPATGTSAVPVNYTFANTNVPQQVWYYRLHMEDTAGVHTYSGGIKIQPDPLYAQPFTYTGPTVTKVGSYPFVQWVTTREKNTLRFTVERSLNNTGWTGIRTIAAAGNSTTARSYSFTDSTVFTQNVYYRLKMEDTGYRAFYSASALLAYATGPFALTSFTVTRDYDDGYLNWSTASETNTSKFVLQRSVDSVTWDILAFVPAAGNSTTARQYTYKDPLVPSIAFFYRLKMETTNGSATYSPAVKALPDPVQLQPVNLSSFTAVLVGGKPSVQWTSSIEKESSKWRLQRSTNGWSWTTVSTQNAAGRTLTGASYSYNDNFTVTALTHYRVQLEDSAARTFNSSSISVSPGSGSRLAFAAPTPEAGAQLELLTPNPTSGDFRINGLSAGGHQVEVFNTAGALVYRHASYENGTRIEAGNWSSGIYYVLIDGGKTKLRLVKQ